MADETTASDSKPQLPPSPPGASRPPRKTRSRRMKYFFIALLVFGAAIIITNTLGNGTLEGWGNNLGEALKEAQKNKSQVVVFFSSKPPNSEDKAFMIELSKDQTKQALARGRIVTVHLNTRDNPDEVKEFNVKSTPVTILLDCYKKELKRLTHTTSHVSFYSEFLGLK